MLNPIEKFKCSIIHLNRDWNHWSGLSMPQNHCIWFSDKIDTMSQFLPVRGVGAKFLWGEFGHHRRQRLSKQIQS